MKSTGSQYCNTARNVIVMKFRTVPARLEILVNPMFGPEITLGDGDEGKFSQMIYVQEERSDNKGGNRHPHASAREGNGLTLGCFMTFL